MQVNSCCRKSVAAPRVCSRGSLGVFFLSFCGFFVVLFFFPSRALPGCVAREGDARDGVRLDALNLTRTIPIEGLSWHVPRAVCHHPQAGSKPKARQPNWPIKIIQYVPSLAATRWEPSWRGEEKEPGRFRLHKDPAGWAITLMKAASSWALREIYAGMLLTWRNGFCNACGTFFLKAINTATSGQDKLDGLSQIGLFLLRDVNWGSPARQGCKSACALLRPPCWSRFCSAAKLLFTQGHQHCSSSR